MLGFGERTPKIEKSLSECLRVVSHGVSLDLNRGFAGLCLACQKWALTSSNAAVRRLLLAIACHELVLFKVGKAGADRNYHALAGGAPG